ncbi:MAG TPA: PaaI family thioesterase [Candidatus Dormibacteraeota bacterium]
MTQDLAEMVNTHPEGWIRAMGLHLSRATADEVTCEWVIGPQHLQSYGIVHGGVHCGVIETLASVGAAAWAMQHGLAVVGVENNTSFVRAVRSGRHLHAVAVPLTRGRRSQLWEGRVLDEEDKLVAVGRVRLLCLPKEDADTVGR